MADKKTPQGKWTLTVTDEQLRVMQLAMEQFFRTQMGQFWDYAELVTERAYRYDADDPLNDQKFRDFLTHRDTMRDTMEAVYRALVPPDCGKTPEMEIAIDIWSVIRHERWKETGYGKNGCGTTAGEPYCLGPEPPIKCERSQNETL